MISTPMDYTIAYFILYYTLNVLSWLTNPCVETVQLICFKLTSLSFFSVCPSFLFSFSGYAVSTGTTENDVLKALSQIIDPDFGTDIVSCGFVKDLNIDEVLGEVI